MSVITNIKKNEKPTNINYAMIEGIPVEVSTEAAYVIQDKRGLWFEVTQLPRQVYIGEKYHDWTPKKRPVEISSDKGYLITLQTAPRKNWTDTLTETTMASELPKYA